MPLVSSKVVPDTGELVVEVTATWPCSKQHDTWPCNKQHGATRPLGDLFVEKRLAPRSIREPSRYGRLDSAGADAKEGPALVGSKE